jgi:hypothetical protein
MATHPSQQAQSTPQILFATPADLLARFDPRALSWFLRDDLMHLPSPEPPAAIQQIVDPTLGQKATETWVAVNHLIAAIDVWHDWFRQLRTEKDADPAVAHWCQETACHCIQAICALGVNSQPFAQESAKEIFKMLPPLSDWHMAGTRMEWDAKQSAPVEVDVPRWQESPDFFDAYRRRFESSNELRAAALGLRHSLEQFPTAAFKSAVVKSDDGIRLSITGAARYVGVNEKTIRRWRKDGKLNVTEGPDGTLVFSKSALDVFRAAQK